MKNTVRNDASSSNLKGKPMTKTIWLHWLHELQKTRSRHRQSERTSSTTACKAALMMENATRCVQQHVVGYQTEKFTLLVCTALCSTGTG